MTLDDLSSADLWRDVAAGISVLVLFLLSVGITIHRENLPRGWRWVLYAVVVEHAALTYLEVSRARDTPAYYPDVVDAPLVALTLSLVALLVAVIGAALVEGRGSGSGRA